MHQKLHEFIKSKREMLFRPLDPDERPLSDIKGALGNVEGRQLGKKQILFLNQTN